MEKKVAVLEDDQDIRELVEFILSEAGFEVISYDRVARFWAGLRKAKPDLFLLDIMLLDGNGLDICKKLRSAQDTANIPIVIMSAAYDDVGSECVGSEFLKKPFNVSDLLSRVQQLISEVGKKNR